MATDEEIAGKVKLILIDRLARKLHIPQKSILPHGRYIAKINSSLLKKLEKKQDGKLILVTSMSPTPSGEGKTTLTIGLAQALKLLNKKVIACIRQPSLGPFFGVKGGATGSGYSQVLPVEDITLHFTGDDHAVVSAHNLISSIIDNHIHHGNKLEINTNRILWRRVSDINDRMLRKIRVDFGGKNERTEEFHISAASEIMSILCLSQDIQDLKRRIEKIFLAFDTNGNPIVLKDLKIQGAVTALLRNAIHPNLVQSVEGAPMFVHGGPFGNVSLGCSSLIATKMALKLADYVVTEAGFATELGAEKFFDIQCRIGNIEPSAVVIVATIKALRLHGHSLGTDFKSVPKRGLGGLLAGGLKNLEKHIENIQRFGLPFLVAINRFQDDTEDELKAAITALEHKGIPAFIVDVRNKGGKGGLDTAKELMKLCKAKNNFDYLYSLKMSIKEKIAAITKEMYGADGAAFTEQAEKDITEMENLGYMNLPICVAKTPKSLSDNSALLGRPENFKITVQRVLPASGAGFLVAVCGNILLMPGFPEHPLAEKIDP
ncbi:MAG TPA: formate--tetrahydrofolate ligase [Deltaproteobacteria bacterium]|nr:formate--tetrahydrofolate ligase [Deltaproteobacteria bacterium]